MTALGLAVAIPAVLAYNAFTRANRMLLAELDGFAHDLFAFMSTGNRNEAPKTASKPIILRPVGEAA
jgi:biopolymer transport protein ExbB